MGELVNHQQIALDGSIAGEHNFNGFSLLAKHFVISGEGISFFRIYRKQPITYLK